MDEHAELSDVERLLAEQELPHAAAAPAALRLVDAPFWAELEDEEESLEIAQVSVVEEIVDQPVSTVLDDLDEEEIPELEDADWLDVVEERVDSPAVSLAVRVWRRYPRWCVGVIAEVVLRILYLAGVHQTLMQWLAVLVAVLVVGQPFYNWIREWHFRKDASPHYGEAPQLQWVRTALPRDNRNGQTTMEAVLNEIANHTATGTGDERRAGLHQLDLVALLERSDPKALNPTLIEYLVGDEEVVRNALEIIHTHFQHVETIPCDSPFAREDDALAAPMRSLLGLSDAPYAGEGEVYVTSRRAYQAGVGGFAGHAAHSVLSSPNVQLFLSKKRGEKSGERNSAPISSVYAAASSLKDGQRAFIRLSLRPLPGFNDEIGDYKRALEYDEVVPVATASRWIRAAAFIWRWGKFFATLGLYHLMKDAKTAKQMFAGPPALPRANRTPEVSRPVAQVDKTPQTKHAIKDAETAAGERHLESVLRVAAIGRTDDALELDALADKMAQRFGTFDTPVQRLHFEGELYPIDALRGYMGDAPAEPPRLMALTAAEVSHLAPIPDDFVDPHEVNVYRQPFRGIEPVSPIVIGKPGPDCEKELYHPQQGVIPLGTLHKGTSKGLALGLSASELDQHAFLLGMTGSGKSELMKWLIYGSAVQNYPIVLIDPHGKLSGEVMDALIKTCPHRVKDLVLCDLSDPQRPVGFNPLDIKSRTQIANAVVAVTQMLDSAASFNAGGQPRATNYANLILSALAEANLHLPPEDKNNVTRVIPFLMDAEFRQLITSLCSNEDVKTMFGPDGVFDSLGDDKTPGLSKAQNEHALPIIRAFQTLGASESFKNVFSSPENKLDFGSLINQRSIVLVRLARFDSEQKIGEFIASLVLPWLLSSIDEWGRQRDPETGVVTGRGCRVFVDEAPRILNEKSPVMQVLAETRKWDLGLIFAAQYLEQFHSEVLKGALANTKTKIVLSSDISSAKMIAESLDGGKNLVKARDIADLPKYHGFVNTPGAGQKNELFSFASPPMLGVDPDQGRVALTDEERHARDEVVQRSAALLSNSAAQIDEYRRTGLKETKIALYELVRDREKSNPDTSGSEFSIDW